MGCWRGFVPQCRPWISFVRTAARLTEMLDGEGIEKTDRAAIIDACKLSANLECIMFNVRRLTAIGLDLNRRSD
jgi:hypothetical protein